MIATSAFGQIVIPVLVATAAWIGVTSIMLLRSKNSSLPRRQRGWLSRAAYGLFIAATLLLALTSFGSILRMGHMQNYALLAHLAAAGVFTFSMLVVAVVYLPLRWPLEDHWWMERWSALAMITMAAITAGSMFLGMFPLLDTEGLEVATDIHRYSGLATVVATSVHMYTILIRRWGFR
jgi:hypothetical protein